MTLIDIKNDTTLEYEDCKDTNRRRCLAIAIAHYDDMIKASEFECLGRVTHKGYFDE
jgi:hypothetical protein